MSHIAVNEHLEARGNYARVDVADAAAEVQYARPAGIWIHLNIVLYSNFHLQEHSTDKSLCLVFVGKISNGVNTNRIAGVL